MKINSDAKLKRSRNIVDLQYFLLSLQLFLSAFPDPILVSISVYTGYTLQCTLCMNCSGPSVAPVCLISVSGVRTALGGQCTGRLSVCQCVISVPQWILPVYVQYTLATLWVWVHSGKTDHWTVTQLVQILQRAHHDIFPVIFPVSSGML